MQAGLSEESGLLVARYSRDRDAGGHTAACIGETEATARGANLGERGGRDAEDAAQFLVPSQLGDVEQHRPRRVRGIGGKNLPRREVPEDPGVHGPEGEAFRSGHPAVTEQPLHLRSGEVRVENETRSLTHHRQQTLIGQLFAPGGGSPVLPHDGAAQRFAGSSVPRHHGLALVRDADRSDRSRAHRLDDLVEGLPGCLPDLCGVVLHPTRLREVLLELPVGTDGRSAVGEHCPGTHTGGAGVNGHHHGHGVSASGCPGCDAAGWLHRSTCASSARVGSDPGWRWGGVGQTVPLGQPGAR
uniref:Unannotated protein n=1 Tax=freshwater metagenome TaxID=449393 RepID=A0A6J7NLK5_9ZZZZ